MLKYEEYEQVEKNITPFKFQQLQLIITSSATEPMYSDSKGDRFAFIELDSIDDLRMIDYLGKLGVLINYKGALKKMGRLFAFYVEGEFVNLGTYTEYLITKHSSVDEKFCIQFFDTFIFILSQIQKFGKYLKIMTPFMIGLRNPQPSNYHDFGLLLPFACKHLNSILKNEYEQNIKYVAPQIIRHFNSNKQQQICLKQFRKACLYSLGLILLTCFGYSFTGKQRLIAERNNKDFMNIFKKIRKQIKLLHGGKFVPKALKLLLQDCDKSREIIETFSIKIKSDQFRSLKIYKDSVQMDVKLITTQTEGEKSWSQKSKQKSNKTLSMHINSDGSPINLTPNSTMNYTSKLKSQVNDQSPINLDVSFDEGPRSDVRKRGKTRRKDKISKAEQRKQSEIISQKSDQIKDTYKQSNISPCPQNHKIKQNQLLNAQTCPVNHQLNFPSPGQVYPHFNEEIIIQIEDYKNDKQKDDENMTLRLKLQNQSKIIMGIILLSFFIYGIIGYLFTS